MLRFRNKKLSLFVSLLKNETIDSLDIIIISKSSETNVQLDLNRTKHFKIDTIIIVYFDQLYLYALSIKEVEERIGTIRKTRLYNIRIFFNCKN